MCYERINQAAVIEREKNGAKYLAGYYVSHKEINEEGLREYLAHSLPDYMLPSALVRLEKMPLTSNGKLDRKALPEPEIKRTVGIRPPVNETESRLLKIFAGVLGVSDAEIGTEDDFFRLGGDSIKSIQLSSRIKKVLGGAISVKEILKLRTIKNISRNMSTQEREIISEQGLLKGEVGLLPIQEWFFWNKARGIFREYNYWNQSFTLNVPELDIELLPLSVNKLVEYHDALRLSYKKEGNKQYYRDKISINIKRLDAKGLSAGEVKTKLSNWQSDFNIYGGEMISVSYISGLKKGRAQIHIAAHHLIIDSVSWRIIKEDLEKIYKYLEEAKRDVTAEEILGKKGTSYRQWAQIIKEYDTKAEKEIWQDLFAGIKSNNREFANRQKEDIIECEVKISKKFTSILLRKATQVYNTEINDILLAALSISLKNITEKDENYVLLEGHGREEIRPDTDINHTVGWFTTMYPVKLEAVGENIIEILIKNKENIKKIPQKGIGYGAIYGYTAKELPKILFNYLGQFDESKKESGWTFAAGGSEEQAGALNRDETIININGSLEGGELKFNIKGKISDEELEKFKKTFKETLEGLANYLILEEKIHLTPNTRLLPSQAHFLKAINKIYFDYNAYLSVFFIKVPALDEAIFKQSFTKLLEYHDALRLRYKKNPDGTYCAFHSDKVKFKIHKLNAGKMPVEEISSRVKKWNKEIDIFSGKLFTLAYFAGYEDDTACIYLAMQHLNTDGISWLIVRDDLKAIYEYLMKAEREKRDISKITAADILGPKGSSCRAWTEGLYNYASRIGSERAYWDVLLADMDKINKKMKDLSAFAVQKRNFTLSRRQTLRLLKLSYKNPDAGLNTLFISALNMSLFKLTGISSNYIALESHGRDEFDKSINISDTVGWFASPYPIKAGPVKSTVKETVKSVKKSLDAIPNKGIGYTALSLLKPMGLPRVFFNYQGNYGGGKNDLWSFLDCNIVNSARRGIDDYITDKWSVAIVCAVFEGRLICSVISRLSAADMNSFVKDFEQSLIQIAGELHSFDKAVL
jgi:non-ribosomal peptide synthase protein (TIGR01720 family)